VYTHCVWISPALFRDAVDRIDFLRRLAMTTARFEWRCLAYCLMRTHYHLLVAVEDGVLPRAMQRLNYAYSVGYNQRYELRGHVQYARYSARRIVDDDDLLSCYRYVANNPVEAGLCRSACDWPWSSYRAAIGLVEPVEFVDPQPVLACLGSELEFAVRGLREYVENA
jgi:REP element-mobilizing transposase RayT